jgi:anaerobic selenocysteine-containing dehydrogenase
MKRGMKLIVVDPRATWTAMRAEYHLQLRPGTDAALALALLNAVIATDDYDKDFVDRWCYGFDELKERAAQYSPEWAEEVTGVSAEDIRDAARCLVQKPSTASLGLAVDQNPNCLQIGHAVWAIFAICGDLDIPGGIKLGQTGRSVGSTGRGGVGRTDVKADENPLPIAGHEQYPAMDFIINTTQPDCTLDTLLTGNPYPIEFIFLQSTNLISSCITQQPKRWYEALRHKEFICATDLFITPTIQGLADIVLPVATALEHEGLVTFHGCNQPGQFHAITQVMEREGECKSDLEIMLELQHRINPDATEPKWHSVEAYLTDKVRSNADVTIDWPTLKSWVYGRYEIPYRQYELGLMRADGSPGFKTPTGRVELYSTTMQRVGEDPLPYYEEPRFSKLARPEWAEEFPLILTTGARRFTSFHTEHRQIPTLREIHNAATLQINPKTAEKYDIQTGNLVYIENPWGRAKLVADVTPIVKEDVVAADHGWWYPEDRDTELFSVWKSSVNSLMPHKEIGKLGLGALYKSLPCKLYRADAECAQRAFGGAR